MALSYFAPQPPEAFDRRKAAHLLRRSGFGASPAEIQQAVDQGLEATVEQLFNDDGAQEAEFQTVLDSIAGSLMTFDDPGQAQVWWVHRMVRTRTPLREKLTLFWHGHFATSFHKVENGHLMHQQIESLRAGAWGKFHELVLVVAKDPAMLVWLDGESSTKEHPNENFARELMELFTCGIGNYTEQDVLEGARAFTGWHRQEYRYFFEAETHDTGRKRFLGKSGHFDGGDVIDILMQQPATPRFLAKKLLRFFAGEPSPEVLDEAAGLLAGCQMDVKWFLRDLFLSQHFYSDQCYRKRIASPAEYVIGLVRTLGARTSADALRNHMTAMGQELLAPPNVKGWDGEQKWINSSTWPARVAFANEVTQFYSDQPYGQHLPLEEHVPLAINDPAQTIDALAELVTQGDLSAEVRSDLANLLVTTNDGHNPDAYRDDEGFRRDRNRAALATILSLPEYHAC